MNNFNLCICGCGDVSNLKYTSVKMLLLRLGLGLPSLVKKIPIHSEEMGKIQTQFPRSGTVPRSGMHTLSVFCVTKRKKGNKGKEERVLKQKLLKVCHQGQNVTVLAILERLKFKYFLVSQVADKYFSVFFGPSALKSISTAPK